MPELSRCGWAQSEPNLTYHDTEWGVPSHDDRHLFEMLILEGAQAGLSWITILKRRQGYKDAFYDFDVQKVARITDQEQQEILANANIIKNRAKVLSTVNNANQFLKVQEQFGSFDNYIWRFADGQPIVNNWTDMSQLPASTTLSDQISKDLKKRGFNFIGSTIMYAYMQATGLVDDHLVTCFRKSRQ